MKLNRNWTLEEIVLVYLALSEYSTNQGIIPHPNEVGKGVSTPKVLIDYFHDLMRKHVKHQDTDD